MTEILEDWIKSRLGIAVDFNNVGNEFFDGNLFFKILQSYDIVGSEVKFYIRRAKNPDEALRKLTLLKLNFKLLGVLNDNNLLEEISKKNGKACIELLSELYLKLSNKHNIPIISKAKEKQVLQQDVNRFKSVRVTEKKCLLANRERPEAKLLSRLQNSNKMFNTKASETSFEEVEKRSSKLEETSSKIIANIKKGLVDCKCGTTVEECLKRFDERIIDNNAMGDSVKNVCSPDEYIKMLKLRTFKQTTDKKTELKLRDIIVKKLWCKQMKEREKELKCSLAKKFMKQSNYEKEMSKRLGRIHLQYKIMTERRRKVHEEAQRIHQERLETIEWRQNTASDEKYFREKKRLEELHTSIYKEKKFKMREEKISMIKKLLSDLVDMSIKIAQYQIEYSTTFPEKNLKQIKLLFFKSLPLFSDPPLLIQQEDDSSVSEKMFDTYLHQDPSIEDELNKNDLNEYLLLLGPWAKELWPDLENLEEEINVLGFVVHRLLENKYPFPEVPKPVEIPLYPIRAIINNITDDTSVKNMKTLMRKPNIEVIDLPYLISTCIGQYKKEAGIESKPAKPIKKGRESKITQKQTMNNKKKENEPPFKSVETQFPSETGVNIEPELSKLAEFGKRAFEYLGTGASVPGELVTEILIEYLFNLTERDGWVLINFPIDCYQVRLLEFKFTGLEPPIKCEIPKDQELNNVLKNFGVTASHSDTLGIDESIAEDEQSESELSLSKLEKLRTSTLVPRPNPKDERPVFHTYFTHYIEVENTNNKTESETQDIKLSNNEKKESVDEDIANSYTNSMDTPKSFYEKTDIYHLYSCSKLDFSALMKLARILLNETDEPGLERKTSEELFGDELFKKVSKSSRKSKTKNSKYTPIVSAQKVPETVNDEQNSLLLEDELKPCKVGEPCWEYTTPDVPSEAMIALASFWESIEITYINNLKNNFSFYREHDAIVIAYRSYVFKKITTVMETLDNRQNLINEFVSEVNGLDDNLRCNIDVKKELFCKVFELQLKLWDLCDTKKNICEQEREKLINENWLSRHTTELYNIFAFIMETEIDRFTDSLQLLHDYYKSTPSNLKSNDTMKKIHIPRYKPSDFEYVPDIDISANESREPIVYNDKKSVTSLNTSLLKRNLEMTLDPINILHYYRNLLQNVEFDKSSKNELLESMKLVEHKIQEEVLWQVNQHFTVIEKERKLLMPKQSKPRTSKTQTAKTKKKGSKFSIQATSVTIESDPVKLAPGNALIEWSNAIQDEKDRLIFRISLIKNRFADDVLELEELMTTAFHGLRNEISARYSVQVKNCDSLLKVLMTSIEAGSKIEAKLELTLEKFCVIPDGRPTCVFSDGIIPPAITPIEEANEDFTFTIQQLHNFAQKMISVSPLGILTESLVSIIEDMVLLGKENGHPYLPKGWLFLSQSDIREVIHNVFGDVVVVDWKDLLIFGLEFEFPSLEEIIALRNQFLALDPNKTENVTEEMFRNLILWFEKNLCNKFSEDIRVVLGKRFLYNLYKIDEYNMNYTAFLLNYCKDENPLEGFGKALALSTGFGYVLCGNKLYLLESTKPESSLITNQIINSILENVFNSSEGSVITNLKGLNQNNMEEDFEHVKHNFDFNKVEKQLDDHQKPMKTNMSDELTSKRLSKSSSETLNSEQSLKNSSSTNQGSRSINFQQTKTANKIESYAPDSNVVWKSWLPREVVLSILLTSLHTYALPEEKYYLQEQVESQIKAIYDEFGVNDCIQGHVLAQTPFMKSLLSTCFKFKYCDLQSLIRSTVYSRSSQTNMFQQL